MPKRKASVQPQDVPKHEVCISLQERETHVQPKSAPERDLRVSILKRENCVQQGEVRVQPQEAKFVN